jgi:hypothetical protein
MIIKVEFEPLAPPPVHHEKEKASETKHKK